jgi:hypothetical protein
MRRHRNKYINSERTSTNTKVKQRHIKREIYELKMTTQNIKQELNKDIENLREKESHRNPGNKKSL